MAERLILMGVIGKPHGVRGLARVNAYTDDPEALANYKLTDKAGRRFGLEWVGGGIARLNVDGRPVADRDQAELLTNTELFAPRAALPAAAAEEFYFADLVGLAARDAAGGVIGTVAAVHDYGGGVSLEIAPGAMIVPFTKAAVPVVDVAGGYAVIEPPAEATP